MAKIKTIKEFDCCPHCQGKTGYFQKVRSKGTWHDNTGWDGIKANTEMMDSFVDTFNSKFYKCMDCYKTICRV